MAISLACGCGQMLLVTDQQAGKEIDCPFCHARVQVSGEATTSPSLETPAVDAAPVSIHLTCACGEKLVAMASLAGEEIACPACQKPVRVPNPEPLEPSLPYRREYGGWLALAATVLLLGLGIFAFSQRRNTDDDPSQPLPGFARASNPLPLGNEAGRSTTSPARRVTDAPKPSAAIDGGKPSVGTPAETPPIPVDESSIAAMKQRVAEYERLMKEGNRALAAGQYDIALQSYAAANRALPGTAAALEGLRRVEQAIAEEIAAQTARQEEADRKKRFQAFLEGGRKKLENRDLDGAAADLAEALRLKPGDPVALSFLRRVKEESDLLLKRAREAEMANAVREPAQESSLEKLLRSIRSEEQPLRKRLIEDEYRPSPAARLLESIRNERAPARRNDFGEDRPSLARTLLNQVRSEGIVMRKPDYSDNGPSLAKQLLDQVRSEGALIAKPLDRDSGPSLARQLLEKVRQENVEIARRPDVPQLTATVPSLSAQLLRKVRDDDTPLTKTPSLIANWGSGGGWSSGGGGGWGSGGGSWGGGWGSGGGGWSSGGGGGWGGGSGWGSGPSLTSRVLEGIRESPIPITKMASQRTVGPSLVKQTLDGIRGENTPVRRSDLSTSPANPSQSLLTKIRSEEPRNLLSISPESAPPLSSRLLDKVRSEATKAPRNELANDTPRSSPMIPAPSDDEAERADIARRLAAKALAKDTKPPAPAPPKPPVVKVAAPVLPPPSKDEIEKANRAKQFLTPNLEAAVKVPDVPKPEVKPPTKSLTELRSLLGQASVESEKANQANKLAEELDRKRRLETGGVTPATEKK